jgi:inosine/xanthosine triphosphatase
MLDPRFPAYVRALRLIAVGSGNPVKLAAVRAVLGSMAPDAECRAVTVASGVPDQPVGDDETIRGALERARAAQAATGADIGVGLEGGVVELPGGGLRTCAWAAVVTADGRTGIGGSLAMPLPAAVARLVRDEGLELGVAMDRLTGQRDIKHRGGAVGVLTSGLIDRQRAYETLVTYAMAPLLSEHYSG